MTVEIKAVERDEQQTYEAFQIEATKESITFALTWLMPGVKESDHTPAQRVLTKSWAGDWLVKSSAGGLERVSEVDFAADWSVIEADPLAGLEEEFATPALSDELKERGTFSTEETWEWEIDWADGGKDWIIAGNEDHARTQAKGDAATGRVRMQTKTSVTSPWRIV